MALFFCKHHVQCLPPKEAEPVSFPFCSKQHWIENCLLKYVRLTEGAKLKFPVGMVFAAVIWKDSQLPVLKIMLQGVFPTPYLSEHYEPVSLVACLYASVQKCRHLIKLENMYP